MNKNISTDVDAVRKALAKKVTITQDRAKAFFKTEPGHYSEKDIFIGVTVPNLRKLAKEFAELSSPNLQKLIRSKINEERLLALIILVQQYKIADNLNKERLYRLYLNNLKWVNNWNLVDSSAHYIVGAHLWNADKTYLFELAKSKILWDRRIAIVATWYFIRNNDLEWTFKIAGLLIKDEQDLIHKAVGWMLREAGKRNSLALLEFLQQHAMHMPRTMLRYAIEKFPKEQRKLIMQNSF